MNPLPLVFTVIGGLLLAALLGWIRRPRLVVLVPRSFAYSQLTDRGQIVEISVFNRGFKTEEAVDVVLNPRLRYEIVGANAQDIQLNKNKIEIRRIAPSDEATLLLIVEDGVFKADDITHIVSKETKGRTVSKLEEVPPTGAQRIALVSIFIAVPIALYGFIQSLDYIAETAAVGKFIAAVDPETVDLHNWTVPSYTKRTSNHLFLAFEQGKIVVIVLSPTRKGDIVSIPLKIQNSTERNLKFSAAMTTTSSEKQGASFERGVSDVIVVPGQTEERTIRVVAPEKTTNPADRIVFIEANIQTMDGEMLVLKQEYTVR